MSQISTDQNFNEVKPIESNEKILCAISPENATSNEPENETKFEQKTKNFNEIERSNVESKSFRDFSGVDTESFIVSTLRDHPKDRPFLFELEKILREFVHDDQRATFLFSPMNSYERMLVHRVAAFFGLKHNVDQSGQSVFVEKMIETRIPEFLFESIVSNDETTFAGKIPMQSQTNGAKIRSQDSHGKFSSSENENSNRSNSNRNFRKQNRLGTKGFDLKHFQVESSSQQSNAMNQSAGFGSIVFPTFPQQQFVNGSSIQNFVPVLTSQNSSYPQTISFAPVLLQPSVNSRMSYVYRVPNPQQIPFGNSTRPFAPIYPNPNINGSAFYHQGASLVHVYPTSTVNTYFPTVPQTNIKHFEYPTNQFAMLNLQSSHDNLRSAPTDNSVYYRDQYLVQSSLKNGHNGTRLTSSRQARSNQPDKIKPNYQNQIQSTIHNQQSN